MNFSPAYIASYFVRPLRYLFENFAPEELIWSSDPKKSMIEIDTINNFNKIAIEARPRILVSRGQYQVRSVGLTDNMAEGVGIYASKGARRNINMLMIEGTAQIMVEARNEGTCEKVLELTQHYLTWTAPLLADTFGFKNSFLPMGISSCVPNREDTEIFSSTINLPWVKEEHFKMASGDDIKFKSVFLSLVNEDSEQT